MFAVSRALSRSWNPGDEIVVSEMDHHSHIDTWVLAARDRGVVVRHLPVDPEALTLDLADLDATVNAKTRLVAVGYASNAVGTINDVARISRRCREVGALLSVDAVHIAPHKTIDMDAIGADMLFCSVYKFFGGHIGIAAIRKNVFEALDTHRLHPAPSTAPGKLETGTQSHEAIASIVPAVDFISGLGTGSTRRERLVSGFERIERHENALVEIIRQGLAGAPGLTLYQSEGPKTATVAFTLEGQQPATYAGNSATDTASLPPMGTITQKRSPTGSASTGSAAGSGLDSPRTTPKRKRNCLSGPSAKSQPDNQRNFFESEKDLSASCRGRMRSCRIKGRAALAGRLAPCGVRRRFPSVRFGSGAEPRQSHAAGASSLAYLRFQPVKAENSSTASSAHE